MHLSAALILSLTGAVFAIPRPAAAAGSKSNAYLVTCVSRGLLVSDTSSAVIYYNGPATSRSSPSDVGTVSEPARSWEGATRRTSLNKGIFEAKIERGAGDLAKSQIAGSAKLGSEEFVCFKDGSSTFRFSDGLLGLGTENCKADFWCASLDV